MAKKQNPNHKPKKQKVEWRRVLFGGLAAVLALLLLLPMVTMILGGAGAVTQSEIDALKAEQAASQARSCATSTMRKGRTSAWWACAAAWLGALAAMAAGTPRLSRPMLIARASTAL